MWIFLQNVTRSPPKKISVEILHSGMSYQLKKNKSDDVEIFSRANKKLLNDISFMYVNEPQLLVSENKKSLAGSGKKEPPMFVIELQSICINALTCV